MSHESSRPLTPHEAAIEDVLGPLGAAVMRIAWEQGECTVASVADALNAGDRHRRLAYTTVMTVMGRLFERGLLERTRRGRQYAYRPASDEPTLIEMMGGRAVDELMERYGTAALRQFAHRLADIDPELRAQLLELASRRQG